MRGILIISLLVLVSIVIINGEEKEQDVIERKFLDNYIARQIREAKIGSRRRHRNKKANNKGKKGGTKKKSKYNKRKGNNGKYKKTGRKHRRRQGWKKRNGKRNGKRGNGRRKHRRKPSNTKSRKKPESANVPTPATCPATEATCIANILLAKKLKTKGQNYEAQYKRLIKFNSTGTNKYAQRSDFKSLSDLLADVGGGNKSNLSCSGSTTNNGSKSLKASVDILDKCEAAISLTCNVSTFSLPPNFTIVEDCKSNFDKLKEIITKCDELDPTTTTSTQYCDCYKGGEDTEAFDIIIKKAQECKKLQEFVAATKTKLKNCTNTFKSCSKTRRDACPLLYTCAQSVADLQAYAAKVENNLKALKAARATITKLTSGKRSRRRHIRNALDRQFTTCSALLKAVAELLAESAKTHGGDGAAIATSIAASTVTDCTEEDLISLKASEKELEAAESTLSETLDKLKAAIEAAGGDTSSTSTATQSPSRKFVMKHILAKLTH